MNTAVPQGGANQAGLASSCLLDASLYVHVPFCLKRCRYCAFTSNVFTTCLASSFLDALELEAGLRLPEGFSPKTIYIGGGTPTSLPAELLRRLLNVVQNRCETDRYAEVTVEANPGTLSVEKAKLLHEGGCDRISLGIQSFDDGTLQFLGRIHVAREAVSAFRILRAAGFDNISIDLIFAVPGRNGDGNHPPQPLDQWRAELRQAVELQPEHISTYCLSVEAGTEFARLKAAGQLIEVDEETQRAMYEHAHSFLAANGYEHYEISNFAKPGRRSVHNTRYWTGASYVGLGPSAAGFTEGTRWTNIADVHRYVEMLSEGTPPTNPSAVERLEGERAAREALVIGLRMLDGVECGEFKKRTGIDPLRTFADELSRLAALGMIDISGGRIRLTKSALPVADSVLAELV